MTSGFRKWSGAVPAGWLPVTISEPHLLVRWMRVRDDDFPEPFFDESVMRLRAHSPVTPEFETEFASIEDAGRYISPTKPAGIIFHMSRCGSTLIHRALRTADRVIGISEAPPVEKLLQMCGGGSNYWSSRSGSALRSLASLFGSYRGQLDGRLVIKTGVTGLVSLPALRLVWPDVPCLISIREPIEVLISNLKQPARWLVELCRTPCPSWLGVPGADLTDFTPESLAAWMVGRFCAEALRRIDSGCMVLDYRDINAASIRTVASRFGLTFAADSEERLDAVLRADAKSPTRTFQSDSAAKRSAASESLLRICERAASEPYFELMRCPQRIVQ